ncbi:hypothetical protein [Idiomarina seosinensis]|uniref:Uncharacterized protein n=1 Tax=Idiomarina seosinensis TaxID=281739 RepID=A0A432ZIR7_9GAMM|nr:hypothetical protein [Idiomarina seosinensis]RUO77784.1 hypothetical protein CWI81_04710 [Idiomarina seosinensis]
MDLNATLIGQLIFVLAIIMAVISYYLGKRKTQTPLVTTIVGLVSAFVPPLAIIFLMALVLKNDVTETP